MAQDFKTTIDETVNPLTGEVVSVKRRTERIKVGKQQSYLLLRTTDGLGYLRALKGSKLHILLCMSFYAFTFDNTVNTSPAFWDEVCALLQIQKRQAYRILRELELDMYVVKLWGGKYMLNPDVMIIGGSKYYEQNTRRFEKALKWRATGEAGKDKFLQDEFRLFERNGKETTETTENDV